MFQGSEPPCMSKIGEQTALLGLVLGSVLIVVGVGAYAVTEFASVTALIPAIFGALIAGLGAIGRSEPRQRVANYGIGVLAVLGVVGSLRAVPDIVAALTGDSVDSVVATVTQGAMIVVCLVLVGAVGWYAFQER